MASKFDDPHESAPPAKVVELRKAAPQPRDGFPVTWVSDAVLKLDGNPIVKGLIDPGAFVLIYGPSGSGKSFFTADLGQHIATGRAWRGRKVAAGLVVYIAAEAGASILKRFVAWRDNRVSETLERVPLAVLTRGPNLISGTDFETLAAQLASLQQEAGLPLTLVVFDTLSRSMPGGDENKAEDMTRAIQAADHLRDQFNCATVFVHHSGKQIDNGARGHSSLFAAADLVLQVVDGQAKVEKVRDGVSGELFPFVLEPVEIGLDADGDAVMTCLLNVAETAVKREGRAPTGQNQRLVLPALRDMAQERGERSPGTTAVPKGVLLVSMVQAIERCVPKFGGDDPAFRVREKIRTAILGLQAAGFVGVHGDIIWLL